MFLRSSFHFRLLESEGERESGNECIYLVSVGGFLDGVSWILIGCSGFPKSNLRGVRGSVDDDNARERGIDKIFLLL